MPRLSKTCRVCNSQQHVCCKKCSNCGAALTKSGKKVGRPKSTTVAAGYNASSGRPLGSTKSNWYNVSDGRPSGTTLAAGYSVSDGRRAGTTLAAGYSVLDGRPVGSTEAAGCKVGRSGGRPEGTPLDCGYSVGRCSDYVFEFDNCDIPQKWGVSSNTLNISDSSYDKLKQRIGTQRAFDKQPLTKQICWQCGCVLWGDGCAKGTYLIDPPKGMSEKDAPANAFLKL